MKETLLLTITAHLVADFILQTQWMVEHKKRAGVLLLHAAIVGLTAAMATGQWRHPLLA